MITKGIPQDTKPAMFLNMNAEVDDHFNYGAPGTPYYVYSYPHDLSKIASIMLIIRGKKIADASADNTLKLKIDTTTELTKTYANTVSQNTVDRVDVSSYSGEHTVSLYIEGGTDAQVFRELVMVGLSQ